ncbi:hypothetical protein BRADI_1g28193v3 [Brachypodium distachyon]|uniref:At2g35280-like TPR domain-containing protein n=1 Tax=Brachypodium distachyon TaxID=15368 RepID=A0A2K2DLJ5_BRADI|nr:hypothetical protein BRADI_1g28193v3 [Brachypodium distachyon]
MYDVSKEQHWRGRRRWSGINWRYLALLKHLDKADNPEANFIVGLKHIFTQHNIEQGCECLGHAADSGHKTVAYVLSVVLYTLKDKPDLVKRYISQVEGDVIEVTKEDQPGVQTAPTARCKCYPRCDVEANGWHRAAGLGAGTATRRRWPVHERRLRHVSWVGGV